MVSDIHDELKDSAKQTKSAAQHTANAAQLAKAALIAERSLLLTEPFAAERTLAAWVRTGLLALASGIGAKKLLEWSPGDLKQVSYQ
jgi:putative membrane protein